MQLIVVITYPVTHIVYVIKNAFIWKNKWLKKNNPYLYLKTTIPPIHRAHIKHLIYTLKVQ